MAPGEGNPRRAAAVVLSDRAAGGEYVDLCGPVLRRELEAWGLRVQDVVVVPDDPVALTGRLDRWRAEGVSLVLTSGGTGLGPRDRTPETLRGWAERDVPGIGEWLRAESARHTCSGWLSRGGGWVGGGMLVVALPGSPRALEQLLPGLREIALHALDMIAGKGH